MYARIAFFDCFSGISGDMCLGAVVDAGVDINLIEKELQKIPVKGFRLSHKKVLRSSISATKVDVIIKSEVRRQKSEAKRWKDIEKIIKTSYLSEKIKQKGLHIFKKIFEAEAMVHGVPFDEVHLHELGGVDCIVDIFGTLIGLDSLDIKKIYVSPINIGSGSIKTEHGLLPVPAPATAELLKGYAVYSSGVPFELTTPTGAAIVSGLNAEGSSLPELITEKIGYGAGNKNIDAVPNTLRLFVGKETSEKFVDSVVVIETNIDDMNPQIYEDVMEKLFKAGALDVFMENIVMKKGRPSVKMTVIANAKDIDLLANLIFTETTSLGLRFYEAKRKILDREIKKIKTRYGDVRIKIAQLNGKIVNISPEYEDLKAISDNTRIPIKELMRRILRGVQQYDI